MIILRPSLDTVMHMLKNTLMVVMDMHMGDMVIVMVVMVIPMDLKENPQQRRELNTAPSFMLTGMMTKRMVVAVCPPSGSMQ